MITKDDVAERLREKYNRYMSVYDYGSHVRLTNGSAGMYVDIEVSDNCIKLSGRRYSYEINKRCDRDLEALDSTLDRTI